jgi:hypothetical protein
MAEQAYFFTEQSLCLQQFSLIPECVLECGSDLWFLLALAQVKLFEEPLWPRREPRNLALAE